MGHVGRFCHQKNHMFLLETFADFNKQVPNSKLILVGDGPLRNKITEKIKELDIQQHVILLGVREDIHPYYKCLICLYFLLFTKDSL